MPAGSLTPARGTARAADRTVPPVRASWTAPSAPEPVTRTRSASNRPSGPGESRTTGRVSGTTSAWRGGARRRGGGAAGGGRGDSPPPRAGRPALRRALRDGETHGRSVERLLKRRGTSGLL